MVEKRPPLGEVPGVRLAGFDDSGITFTDEATLLTASNALVTELVVVSATAMDGKTLNVASDARPADRNDCEIDGSTRVA